MGAISFVQFWLAVVVCVSEFLCLDCVFRFSFVLMEDRRCLLGGIIRSTPSVTYGASSLKREPFGAFPRIGETDFSLPELYPTTRVSLRNTLRGNQKQVCRTY